MFHRRLDQVSTINIQVASAGSWQKKPKMPQIVAIPLRKCEVASHSGKTSNSAILHDAPVKSMIAAPGHWCPNPAATTCLRVCGNSMAPLTGHGYILAVDSSQHDHAKPDGSIVIAWHKNKGLMVSRLKRYGPTEVLEPENKEYEPIVLNNEKRWKILAKVLWWIGKSS